MSRFIAVIHGWHVDSKGFDVHEIDAASAQQADDQACLLAARRDAAFDRTAYAVIQIGDRECLLPRRLTWRERLTGQLQPSPQGVSNEQRTKQEAAGHEQ